MLFSIVLIISFNLDCQIDRKKCQFWGHYSTLFYLLHKLGPIIMESHVIGQFNQLLIILIFGQEIAFAWFYLVTILTETFCSSKKKWKSFFPFICTDWVVLMKWFLYTQNTVNRHKLSKVFINRLSLYKGKCKAELTVITEQ